MRCVKMHKAHGKYHVYHPYMKALGNFQKKIDTWVLPQRFCFNCSEVWSGLFKSPQVILMWSQALEPLV